MFHFIIIAIIAIIVFIITARGQRGYSGSSEKIADVPFMPCVPPYHGVLPNKHHGQRKLFMAELDLLTRVTKRLGTPPDYFVYAGAAPCIHMGYLMKLFPTVKMILIDPNEFSITDGRENIINYDPTRKDIVYLAANSHDAYPSSSPKMVRGIDGKAYSRDDVPRLDTSDELIDAILGANDVRVFIIQKLMTRDLAKKFSRLPGNVVFMSDIRTNSDEDSVMPTNGDLLWNMAQMYVWVQEMKPYAFSHKHRLILGQSEILPHMIEDLSAAKELGLDLLTNPYRYLAGDEYLQVWTTRHSPETRLVGYRIPPAKDGASDETICSYTVVGDDYTPVTARNVTMIGDYMITDYDAIEYDQKNLYHNRIERTGKYDVYAKKIDGIDDCWDCHREADMWKEYFETFGISATPSLVSAEMINLGRYLVVSGKGDLASLHKKMNRTNRKSNANTKVERLIRDGSREETDDFHHPIYDPVD